MEDVNDEIHIVQQSPAPRLQTLYVVWLTTCLTQRAVNVFGQCSDVYI